MHEQKWNCRLVQFNGEAKETPWVAVRGYSAKQAASAFCDTPMAWDHVNWTEDCEGVVEVEAFGGEDGVRKMTVRSYSVLQFSATPEGED